MKEFELVREESVALASRYAERDSMLEEMRKMFAMEWNEEPKGDWIKATMSPGAYNAVMGAVRLMTATDPQINAVVLDAPGGDEEAEAMELAARAMWDGSGRVTLRPAHYEIVFSALLFGEICASVTRVSDLVALSGSGLKPGGAYARFLSAERDTPFIFTVYNPATCYGDFDQWGLRGMLRRIKTTWGDVCASWGKLAEDSMDRVMAPGAEVTLNDWYDWDVRSVWVDGAARAILHDEHNLGFLPVVDQVAEGTYLFAEPERQRYPLLYAVWKSGLWKRENLSLTTVYSLIDALGSSPLLKRKTPAPGSALHIDRTVPGGVVDIGVDESIEPLVEKVVDPSQWEGLKMAARLNEESTISRQALGGQPDRGMSFSAISLLSQAGRLPLTAVKAMAGAAIGKLLGYAFQWWKVSAPGTVDRSAMWAGLRYVDITAEDVPDQIAFSVNLEPDVPQDKLQLANVGAVLVSTGLASKRWVRENIMMIGQSELMDEEIAREAASAPVPAAASGASVYPAGGVGSGEPLSGPMQPMTTPIG